MHTLLSLAPLLGAVTGGAISPGPSFVFVARTSMAASRGHGLATALGLGFGAMCFALLVMFGLQALLTGVPWVFFGLQILGGLYLLYLAFRIWQGANAPLVISADGDTSAHGSRHGAFWRGVLTQVSNPKAAVVYGSIFAALLPRELPSSVLILLPALVFVIEAGWYTLVALVLSSAAPRQVYLRSKRLIDRAAGGVMGLLGVKLLASARLPA